MSQIKIIWATSRSRRSSDRSAYQLQVNNSMFHAWHHWGYRLFASIEWKSLVEPEVLVQEMSTMCIFCQSYNSQTGLHLSLGNKTTETLKARELERQIPEDQSYMYIFQWTQRCVPSSDASVYALICRLILSLWIKPHRYSHEEVIQEAFQSSWSL